MKGKRHYLRWTLMGMVIAAGFVSALFWESLAVYITPKTVLRKAVSDVWPMLQVRALNHPVCHILSSLDERQEIQLMLEASGSPLGSVAYDLRIHTTPGRLEADGTVSAAGREVTLWGYLDEKALAVASEELTGGICYGITFDSFSSDIRQIPLLTWIVSEDMINRWDAQLSSLGRFMADFYPNIPELPDLRLLNPEQLLLGLMALPVKVSNTTVELNGEDIPCQRISFRAEGRHVGQYLDEIQLPVGETAAFTVLCYLSEGKLVMTEIQADGDAGNASLRLETGKEPLSLIWESGEVQIQVTSRVINGILSETWKIAGAEMESFTYSLDQRTGAFTLTVENREPIRGVFSAQNDGFSLETEDLGSVRALVSGKSRKADLTGQLALTVTRGIKDVKKPEFRNPDTWTMEDFLVLMEGIGSLIGLKLQ